MLDGADEKGIMAFAFLPYYSMSELHIIALNKRIAIFAPFLFVEAGTPSRPLTQAGDGPSCLIESFSQGGPDCRSLPDR